MKKGFLVKKVIFTKFSFKFIKCFCNYLLNCRCPQDIPFKHSCKHLYFYVDIFCFSREMKKINISTCSFSFLCFSNLIVALPKKHPIQILFAYEAKFLELDFERYCLWCLLLLLVELHFDVVILLLVHLLLHFRHHLQRFDFEKIVPVVCKIKKKE